jgi:hypothetical protein
MVETEKEYTGVVDDIKEAFASGNFEANKVDRTIAAVWKFLTAASVILVKDGKIVKLKWFNLLAYFKLAQLAYEMINEITEIWKKLPSED